MRTSMASARFFSSSRYLLVLASWSFAICGEAQCVGERIRETQLGGVRPSYGG